MTTSEPVSPYPGVPVDASTNGAGRASFVIAVVIIVIGAVQQVVSYSLPLILVNTGYDSGVVSVIFGVFGAVVGVLAIVGLVTGVIGLGRRYAPRLGAAAGTAIAASSLLSVVIGLVMPLILNAL